MWCAYGTFLARSLSSVLHIGQTDVVMDDDEVGEMEEPCDEWHEGVLRAESPAESAICRSGTGGRASNWLCVCMKRLARVIHRDSL